MADIANIGNPLLASWVITWRENKIFIEKSAICLYFLQVMYPKIDAEKIGARYSPVLIVQKLIRISICYIPFI